MKNVLMVCLGNICRSPAAEGFFRHLIKEHRLPIDVDSAGTSDYHIGEAPDPRMQQVMLSRGIDISALRGRQVNATDFERFDHIYAMDGSNFAHLTSLAEQCAPEHAHKVELFLQALHRDNRSEPEEVPDPYFGGQAGFEACVDLIQRGAVKRIEQFKE
ncbi:low molecular weight protein-tyrosine-phosphatase [Idiomarina aquatica]|nr:low molecular weight protein-tyrosine-phosphatase [Idiomarina aquatica]